VTSRPTLEATAADHRDAIASAVRAVRSVDARLWQAPSASGKWSPAEIAEHLCLSYAGGTYR
jgi:hypothetical protein